MKTIPIMRNAAMTYLGSRTGCHALIRCCVNAVSEGMRLPSAAGLAAGATGAAATGCCPPRSAALPSTLSAGAAAAEPSVDDRTLGIAVGEIIRG